MAALRSDQVLRDEAKEILEHRNRTGRTASAPAESDKDASLRRKLNQCKFAALCLSGGGIRSAAFSLGALQALAAFPRPKDGSNSNSDVKIPEANTTARAKNSLLAQFDYLSTVSGGGYIGSWLSAWCSREGFQKVWDNLAGQTDARGVEPRQIGWLRSYSNYLTPKLGMMSADARTAVSIYLCNLFLNWLMILPMFCCAVLGMKILAVVFDGLMTVPNPISMHTLQHFLPAEYFKVELSCQAFKYEDKTIEINWVTYVLWCGIPGVLLLLAALAFVSRHLVLRLDLSDPKAGTSQKRYLFCALLPSVLSAILLAQLLGSDPFGRMFENLSKVGCDAQSKVVGVTVADVKTGPAKDKLQKNDVIVKVDSQPVETLGELEYYLRKKKVGDEVLLGVERETKPTTVQLKWPPPPAVGRDKVKHPRLYPAVEDLAIDVANVTLEPRFPGYLFPVWGGVLGLIVYALGILVGWALSFRRANVRVPVLLAWAGSGAIYGAMLGFAFYLLLTLPGGTSENRMFIDSPALPLTFGVPWILSSQLLAQVVFVGLSSRRFGSDWDREWQGRAGGWMLVAIIGWFAISCLTFGALLLLLRSDYVANFVKITSIPVSAISGIATALLSKSRLTSDNTSHPHEKSIWTKLADFGLAIAAPLFVGGLVFLLSIALDNLLLGHLLFDEGSSMSELGLPRALAERELSDVGDTLWPLVWGLLVFFILLCCASYFININRFSLHAFYRNRLIRAFLGATRERKPDPFHGFDPDDNPNMSSLWPPKAGSAWQPFHIVNITLNLVSGKNLSWQERKAASFTVSPRQCGTPSAFELRSEHVATESCGGAYRPTAEYGGDGGISLGTAMAISGAAVSPNMGYHSSPGMTFLMSMLNVRLGWWLGNPAVERGRPYAKDGPNFALGALLAETLGQTTEDRKYVYLSDGGHFENLGLYEMVRRRCRFILVIDAGYDPKFEFEDLGNAVRKISIDLNVAIRMHGLDNLKMRTNDGAVRSNLKFHAMGELDYQAADGDGQNGLILYIKPAYHGSTNAGIVGYANLFPEFPHQSTADQWFSESQFESYRALGFEIMDCILEKALDDPNCANDPSVDQVFCSLFKEAKKDESDHQKSSSTEVREIMAMLSAIHASEDVAAAPKKSPSG